MKAAARIGDTGTMVSTLVLGGTAWLGASIAQRAIEQGDDVWCLARGDSGTVPAGATWVEADRRDPSAYEQLGIRVFDRVVEVSWQPRVVAQAIEALGSRAGHWTYVSSVGVYASHDGPHDEAAPLRTPLDTAREATHEEYAAAKVACERLTVAGAQVKPLLVRAGLIAGPGDPTDRVGYWPARGAVAADGPLLVPEPTDSPTQSIDVRDLVDWMARACAADVVGPVNAVGEKVSLGELIDASRRCARHQGETVRVSAEWLHARDVRPWSGPRSLPWWTAGSTRYPAIGRHDDTRFLETGGVRRPLADTLVDTLEDERARGLSRPRNAGLTREEELTLIAEPRA